MMSRRFSERKGFQAPSREIQTDSMSDELRNSLWNALDDVIWSSSGFLLVSSAYQAGIYRFSRDLWAHYFKQPVDARPDTVSGIYREIREHFFHAPWNEVYDFLEWVLEWASDSVGFHDLPKILDIVLERELAGFRLVNGLFTDVTDPQEIEALEEALADDTYPGVRSHLRAAHRHLTDREQPDYRNSIKESISAVESMAKAITDRKKATLGDALAELEKEGAIHGALKQSFSSLYGYTSDEGGIRHAMLAEPNLTAADAKFFLLSCTSFINYLKAKL